MTIAEYVASEFRRYFTDAGDITFDFDEEAEKIHVHVLTPIHDDIANHFRLTSWSMNIGSDDDYYVFHNGERFITIPFMPEED